MAGFLAWILICSCGSGVRTLWGQGLAEETLARLKSATVLVKVKGQSKEKTGSGFLPARRGAHGAIVTNAHVVRDEEGARVRIQCVFHSGSADELIVPARVVCRDETNDLAILRVPGRDLPDPLDTETEVNVIETLPVYVLGFPFGEVLATSERHPAITVSQGAVSSIRRDQRDEIALLQIDGGINPGNSGGPIVSASGALVGIAVAKLQLTEIGFAIPKPNLMRMLVSRVESIAVRREARDRPGHVRFRGRPDRSPVRRQRSGRTEYSRDGVAKETDHQG